MQRRTFLKSAAAAIGGVLLDPRASAARAAQAAPAAPAATTAPLFTISLAGWSLHKRHFDEGKMPLVDFPRVAREEFGIGAIELVNTMFPSPTWRMQQQLLKNAEQQQVKIPLIMCDAEGELSSADEVERARAIVNHVKWLDIAKNLGCHSIRVNTGGKPGDEGDIARCIESLKRLGDEGAARGLNVICENHWGMSSDGVSIVKVMRGVGRDNVGTLPDFGNFPDEVDKYAAVAAMLPWAKAVSAKCYDFGADGLETKIDFPRMVKLVTDSGYHGNLGIEYEGERMSEHDGVVAARDLLEKLRTGRARG